MADEAIHVKYFDRIKEPTSNTPGSGDDFQLSGTAVDAHLRFSDEFSDEDHFFYLAEATTGNLWEIGLGRYESSTDDVIRVSQMRNSAGGDTAITFTSTVNVSVINPAGIIQNDDSHYFEDSTSDATPSYPDLVFRAGYGATGKTLKATAGPKVPTSKVVLVEAVVIARQSTSNVHGWVLRGIFQKRVDTTSLLGSVDSTDFGESVSWAATLEADDSWDRIRIKVTGAAATTISWTGWMRVYRGI